MANETDSSPEAGDTRGTRSTARQRLATLMAAYGSNGTLLLPLSAHLPDEAAPEHAESEAGRVPSGTSA
ncbi:hypothetical protein [Streptomyces sp. NPDC095613]|uniref:hypothetical protein n=1 Tax=Streptomyces sp. NPDC095613 TaxID=3155540 RepID=UPI00331B4165